MEQIICVSELSYSGRQGAPLKGLSFSVEKGGIHGILSPTGGEASTLLAILAGAISPNEGSLTVNASNGTNAWKKTIGYVPKHPEVYRDMTVYELLDFVGEARGVSSELRLRQIEEALELVGLSDKDQRLFEKLSLVEKKKASIAAALLGNPSLLLIDHVLPVGASSHDRREIFGLLLMLGKLKTVMVAEEDLSILRELCSDVLLLSMGEVLAQGSFDELDENLARSAEKSSLEELYASLVLLAKEAELERRSLLSGESRKEDK